MRHYSKSHGSHCYLRSFQTSCPKCGADVLYWECSHGSKVFFQYPPYGKLIKHHCRFNLNTSEKKNKFPVIVKKPKFLFEEIYLNCPICGKGFKNKISLKDHFNQMRKIDLQHKNFFKNQIKFVEEIINRRDKLNFKMNYENQPKFGRINIKKRNNKG